MVYKELYKRYGKVTNIRVTKGLVKFSSTRSEWSIKSKPKKESIISIELNELLKE